MKGSKLDQVQANIQYLEIEKSRNLEEVNSGREIAQKKSVFNYKGHFQFRTESASNLRGVQASRQSEESFSRFRTYLQFSPNDRLDFNLTPQATKGFGANDSSGNTTSGSTTHSELDFFEANIDYQVTDFVSAKLGRQEIFYGEHLVIGTLPWANKGRSFDALKLKVNHGIGSSDLFYSKISDNSTSASSTDDADLVVFYNSFSFGEYFKETDVYYIYQDDDRGGKSEINMFGFRVKGSHKKIFYRTENAIQSGANLGSDAKQFDIEVGSKWSVYSFSLEYALAGADYQQLYPTAHKFLGIADVLGRRNLEQYAFHFKASPIHWLELSADYHLFHRKQKNKSAYKLDGATAWGTSGASDDIGNELDIIFTFNTFDNLKFQLGGAWFKPGTYMKNQDSQGRDEAVRFVYGQINASF